MMKQIYEVKKCFKKCYEERFRDYKSVRSPGGNANHNHQVTEVYFSRKQNVLSYEPLVFNKLTVQRHPALKHFSLF